MENDKSQLIKKIEEIYLTTPSKKIRDIIDSDMLNTLTKIGFGTVYIITSK